MEIQHLPTTVNNILYNNFQIPIRTLLIDLPIMQNSLARYLCMTNTPRIAKQFCFSYQFAKSAIKRERTISIRFSLQRDHDPP